MERKYDRDLLKDLARLDRRERVLVTGKMDAIISGTAQGAPMSGARDCFKVRIGDLRLIYLVASNVVWFLIVQRRGRVYSEYQRRVLRTFREIAAESQGTRAEA